MLVIVISFLVLVCRCEGFPGDETGTTVHKDFQQDPPSSTLVSLLREHEVRTASLLRQQEEKLNDLTDLLRHQTLKLSHQEKKLSHQEILLRQQDQKLSNQAAVLRHQEAKLSYQDRSLEEQAAKLSDLEALLVEERRASERVNNKCSPSQSFKDENLGQAKNRSQFELQDAKSSSESTHHDVMSRSDDAGPLEAVVSHISQQVTEMGADIQTLKNSNTQQDLAIQDAQSSTFVHWGSSTCTNLSDTVYSGVVGGSWYEHTGAASNYLCLTMSPVFSNHPLPSGSAYLFGGEYQTDDSHIQKDPVCAVCRSTLSTTVMIPGTNVCTPGWHLQYSGFLMAGRYNHAAGSEYICVDSRLENTNDGDASEDGKLLYYTETRCGTLPCTPYVNNKVVTCAVCSK